MSTQKTEIKVVALVGPSGSGKTCIKNAAVEDENSVFATVRTATTRKIRPGENDDAYHFLSKKEFEDDIANHKFIETSMYAGNYYGTPIQSIQDILDEGKIAIVPIDINGAMKYKEIFNKQVLVVFIQRDKNAVIQSIIERDVPTEEKAERIMQLDKEYKLINKCDRCIINNGDIQDAVSVLKSFV